MNRKKVCIESPFIGNVSKNLEYLCLCMRDSISRNEAPFAGHGLYPSVLNDIIPDQRQLGIELHLLWGACAEKHVFYIDFGITDGMKKALDWCKKNNQLCEFRKIFND